MNICVICGKNYPSKITIDGKSRNLCNRKNCLDCVPFGTSPNYSTRPLSISQRTKLPFLVCFLCDKPNGKNRRRLCQSCRTKIRRYRAKQAAIKYMGGQCKVCGWIGPQAGYSFHHPDKNKDFNIGAVANRSWDILVEELRKCELLCLRCHGLKHSNREDPRLAIEAERYQGSILRNWLE